MRSATAAIPLRNPGSVISLPIFIVVAATVYVCVGLGSLCAWRVTGRAECAELFFEGPGAAALVAFAALELFLARMVMRQFSDGEPLQWAWFSIALAAGSHLAGTISIHVLSVETRINPLFHARGLWSESLAASLGRFGSIAGGPLAISLLALGLLPIFRTCRRCGILARLGRLDWILLSLVGLCALGEILSVISSLRAGDLPPTAYDLLCSASVPLLLFLLAEAVLLRRAVARLGHGLVAKCWSAWLVAILLTASGDSGLWTAACGWVPPLVSDFAWYFRLLSGAALALAPAWNLEAIRRARGELDLPRLSVMAAGLSALRLLDAGDE